MKSIILACALALALASNLAAQTAVPCAEPVGMAPTVTATASAQTVTVSWSALRGAVSYAVIRKNPDASCWNVTPQGTTATSLQETMMPGGNYEYQVAVQLLKGQGLSEWAPVTVMPSLVTTTPLPVALAPAPTTVTVMPAGPAWLNVGSDIPGRMVVIFAPVPNAAAYRFHTALSAASLTSYGVINAATAERDPLTGGIRIRDHLLNADTTFTWWYGIKALFVNGNDTTASTMSPTASGKSLPNDGPTGLQYTVTPSIGKPGMLKLTLAWNPALPGATGYRAEVREIKDKYHNYRVIAATEFDQTMTSLIVDATGPYQRPFNYIVADIKARQLIELCVQSKWPLFKVPTSNFSCVTIQT